MINKRNILLLPLLAFIFIFGANKVNALEDTSNMTYLGRYKYNDNIYSNIYFDSNNRRLLFSRKNSNNTYTENYFNIPDNYNYLISVNGFSSIILYDSELYSEWSSSENRYIFRCRTYQCNGYQLSFAAYGNSAFTSQLLSYNSSQNYVMSYPNFNTTYSSFDLYNQDKSQLLKAKNLNISLGIQNPTEINFTKVDIHDTDYFGNDYISSVALNINFDIFDTDNFKYQFSLDSGNSWQDIYSNNYVLTLNQNDTVIVRILDNSNNYIIGNSYTITSIEIKPIVEENINFTVSELGITYDNLMKIPLSYLYDNSNNSWGIYKLVFLSKSKEDIESNFYIKLINNENGVEFPLYINFEENVEEIDDYINRYNSSSSGNSGGGYSSGGGRHDISCDISNFPYIKTIYNDNSNYYNILELNGACADHNIDYYSTRYIYIYYNARIYESVDSLSEDYAQNILNDKYSDESNKHFFYYFKDALSYFSKPIKEIFKLIKYFFNRLPVEIRYMIVAVFLIGIALIIFKTLL